MTVIEKKIKIKNLIDTLPEENLDEVLNVVQEISSKELRIKKSVIELLKKEENLFKRLAQ
ncbi:hypothetical protein [Lacinutrix sp. MEBiC02404]